MAVDNPLRHGRMVDTRRVGRSTGQEVGGGPGEDENSKARPIDRPHAAIIL